MHWRLWSSWTAYLPVMGLSRRHAAVCAAVLLAVVPSVCAKYSVEVSSTEPSPVMAYPGNSAFRQVFNPSWVAATSAGSSGTGAPCGLLIRTQNCSAVPGKCVKCGGDGPGEPSVITFARQVVPGCGQDGVPIFATVGPADVVFGPASYFDQLGTEDPRVFLLDNGTYVMFYTSYGLMKPGSKDRSVLLSMASTEDPTSASGWRRHGAVFPTVQGSKSAALLVRSAPPHYLYWGDQSITVARCDDDDLTNWTNVGTLVAPRKGMFDSGLVESGPPPFMLSTGDYLFLHNSANDSLAYHPEWVITSGSDPSKVIQRATAPLLSPVTDWETGVPPALCNVANVVFLEAAVALPETDTYRVFYGGSDDVIGTAVVKVTVQ